jgi:hypothetical protein
MNYALRSFLAPPDREVTMLTRVTRVSNVLAAVLLLVSLSSCTQLLHLIIGPSRPQQTFTVQTALVGETLQFSPDTVVVRTLDFIHWPNDFDGTLIVSLDDGLAMPYQQIISPGDTGQVMIRSGAALTVHKYDVSLIMGADTITVDPYIDVEEEGDGDRGRDN